MIRFTCAIIEERTEREITRYNVDAYTSGFAIKVAHIEHLYACFHNPGLYPNTTWYVKVIEQKELNDA